MKLEPMLWGFDNKKVHRTQEKSPSLVFELFKSTKRRVTGDNPWGVPGVLPIPPLPPTGAKIYLGIRMKGLIIAEGSNTVAASTRYTGGYSAG